MRIQLIDALAILGILLLIIGLNFGPQKIKPSQEKALSIGDIRY